MMSETSLESESDTLMNHATVLSRFGTHFEPAAGLGQWQSGATCGAPTDWQTISFVFHSWFSFISILGFQKNDV
jgi:hypothetical protein